MMSSDLQRRRSLCHMEWFAICHILTDGRATFAFWELCLKNFVTNLWKNICASKNWMYLYSIVLVRNMCQLSEKKVHVASMSISWDIDDLFFSFLIVRMEVQISAKLSYCFARSLEMKRQLKCYCKIEFILAKFSKHK